MRKKTIILTIIEFILLAYAFLAYQKIRGLQIYLISVQLGRIFIYTYIPCFLLATGLLFFLIPLVKTDISEIRKKNPPKTTKQKKCKMICSHCGSKISANQNFCTKCGEKIVIGETTNE